MLKMIQKVRQILAEYTTKKIRFMFWKTGDAFYTDCFLNNFNQDYISLISTRINQLGLVVTKEHNFLVFKSVDPNLNLKFSQQPEIETIYLLARKSLPNELIYRRLLAIAQQIGQIYKKLNYNLDIVEIEGKSILDFQIDKNKKSLLLVAAVYPRDEFSKFLAQNENCHVKAFNRYYYNQDLNFYSNSIAEQILLSSDLKADQLDLLGCNYECSDNLPWVFSNIKKRLNTLNDGGGSDPELARMINLSPLLLESYLSGDTAGAYEYLRKVSGKFQYYLADPSFRLKNLQTGEGGFLKDFWLTLDEYLGSCISWRHYES